MTKTIVIGDDVWVELQRVKSLIAKRTNKKVTYDIAILECVTAFDEQ